MRKILLATVIALSLAGCGTPMLMNYIGDVENIKIPNLNQTVTANLGDNLLDQGYILTSDAIRVTAPVDIGSVFGYQIQPSIFPKTGEDDNYEYFLLNVGAGQIQVDALADAPSSITVRKSDKNICVSTVFGQKSCAEGAYTRTSITKVDVANYRQTLIYNGSTGDSVIRVGYREYSENMARPAFSNEITYDLSDSRIVGYMNARLEILDVSNTEINYRVLSYFED